MSQRMRKRPQWLLPTCMQLAGPWWIHTQQSGWQSPRCHSKRLWFHGKIPQCPEKQNYHYINYFHHYWRHPATHNLFFIVLNMQTQVWLLRVLYESKTKEEDKVISWIWESSQHWGISEVVYHHYWKYFLQQP